MFVIRAFSVIRHRCFLFVFFSIPPPFFFTLPKNRNSAKSSSFFPERLFFPPFSLRNCNRSLSPPISLPPSYVFLLVSRTSPLSLFLSFFLFPFYLFLFFHHSEKYCAFCAAFLLHRAFPGRGGVYFLFMVSWLLFGFLSAACAFFVSRPSLFLSLYLSISFAPPPLSLSLALSVSLNLSPHSSLSSLPFPLIAERISDVFPFASNIDRLEYTRTLHA